jgi:hypothetical protein
MGGAVTLTAAKIVELMQALVPDHGAMLERRDGPGALLVAQEIEGALASAMESKLANVLLWEQFLSTPDKVALALTGVVKRLMGTDPVLADWLAAALERYNEASTALGES